MMTDRQHNDLLLKVNRICFSEKFRYRFTEAFGYCPAGLTYEIADTTKGLEFTLCTKAYGYEHSCNNGISEFSDAFDFEFTNTEIKYEWKEFVYDYFYRFETEFFVQYMVDAASID